MYRYTTPDVGDDATDSDIYLVGGDPYFQLGQSREFDLAYGSEVVLDVGLIKVAA